MITMSLLGPLIRDTRSPRATSSGPAIRPPADRAKPAAETFERPVTGVR